MRILAIRGSNLASLEGRFEVDLASGPLGGAGLYAITGPTGSGKSTILDALCLALFNRVPRVRDAARTARTDPDGDALTVTDPRNVLRRGAVQGDAEVDFVGVDGQSYRASWSVRRARLRPEGQLQSVTMSLAELDGALVAQGIDEPRAAIVERLGLTYEQFTRSVLLAQGDFSAFLRASADERAALLERMTGTALYGELGRRAYGRAKEEGEALARLEADLGAVQTLEPDARAQLEAQRAELVAQAGAVRERAEGARLAQAWHRAADERRAEVADAAASQEAAKQRWQAAAAERAELAAVEAAQAGRAAVQRAGAAAQALSAAAVERERASAALVTATAAEAEAQARAAAAGEAVAAAEAEREARGPDIERALAIDVKGHQARQEAQKAAAAVSVAEQEVAATSQSAKDAEQQEQAALQEARQAETWLGEHPEAGVVAGEWGRWRKEIERLEAGRLRATQVTATLRADRDAQELAITAEAALKDRLVAAQGSLAAAQGEVTAAERAVAEVDQAALRLTREAAVRRLGSFERLSGIARDAARAAAGRAAALRQVEQARQGREQAEAEQRQAAGQDGDALAAAERELLAARAASELAHRRPELHEGEPCPLCGATEHPWAGDGPGDERVEALDKRVTALRDQASEAHRRAAAAAERAAAFEARQREAENGAGEHAAALAVAMEAWGAAAASAGDVPEEPDEGAADVGAAACRAELEAVAAGERRAEALTAALTGARRGAESSREARDAAQAAQREAERARVEASRAVERSEAELERAAEQQAAALAELEPALSPAELGALREDPRAGMAALEALVAQHGARRTALGQAQATLSQLGPRLAELRAAARRALQDVQALQQEHVGRGAALQALLDERRGVLGGRRVEAVRQELAAAVTAAREEQGRAATALQQARAAAAAATATEQACGRDHERRAEELAQAEGALQVELQRLGLERSALVELLAHDEAWRRARGEALRAIDDGRTRAAALLDERRRAQAAHQATGAPALSAEQAAETLRAADQEARDLEERRVQASVRIQADDEATRRRAALGPGVELQRVRADLWRSLSDVIGDATGKTFRNFAQSLSLDLLLDAANARLVDLHRRYRLQRIAGREMDIQIIDGDMGDDARSVSSLSGGESFLVSLALALGLSSLSSRNATIGSLFIDEGFGSLDPETLHRALGALESLQATGCQVGLISHVDGLAERLGARVTVVPRGAGRSEVRVVGAWG